MKCNLSLKALNIMVINTKKLKSVQSTKTESKADYARYDIKSKLLF